MINNGNMASQIRCIIVDDDAVSGMLLSDLLTNWKLFNLIQTFTNPLEAHTFITENEIDLIFLDVEMPEISGVALAKMIDKKIKVVLTTSNRDYSFDGFEIDAYSFIHKPVTVEKLTKLIGKLAATPAAQQLDAVFIKDKSTFKKLILQDVFYIEAYGDYVKIFSKNKTEVINQSLSNILNELNGSNFQRIHRKYIINADHIDSFDSTIVKVNGELLPISRSYRTAFFDSLKKIE